MSVKKIAIIGGHGKIAQLLTTASDREVVSIIRSPDQAAKIQDLGARPALVDIETASVSELAQATNGIDAIIFAAGGGPQSGIFRKYTVDLGASIKAQQAARLNGIRRFIQISFIGAQHPTPVGTDPTFAAYWDAKRIADDSLRAADLDYTIVKPGMLTDEPATGRITIAKESLRAGDVSTARGDVAGFILAILDDERTFGHDLDIADGGLPYAQALDAVFT